MCGRYVLDTTIEKLIETFQLMKGLNLHPFPPRFKIALTSSVPVVRQPLDGDRVVDLLNWDLISDWVKDSSIGAELNNARGETVAEIPFFRSAFKSRRCLVPMSGFYEWKTHVQGVQAERSVQRGMRL